MGKLLPTLTEIITMQKMSLVEPDFVQILTDGPTEIRELTPVFIIPGISGHEEVKKLAGNLLYPTYCAIIPATTWSLYKLAQVLAKVS